MNPVGAASECSRTLSAISPMAPMRRLTVGGGNPAASAALWASSLNDVHLFGSVCSTSHLRKPEPLPWGDTHLSKPPTAARKTASVPFRRSHGAELGGGRRPV